MPAIRHTTSPLPLLIAILALIPTGCSEPVPEETVVAEANVSALRSEILSTLEEIKAGEADPSAVLDVWPEEDEVIPEAHRATFDKLQSAAEALAEMSSPSEISTGVEEIEALARTLPDDAGGGAQTQDAEQSDPAEDN